VDLNVDPQAVIDDLSMQVAQYVRDNTVLRAQNTSLVTQLRMLEEKASRAETQENSSADPDAELREAKE
jgi:hypothetical protein